MQFNFKQKKISSFSQKINITKYWKNLIFSNLNLLIFFFFYCKNIQIGSKNLTQHFTQDINTLSPGHTNFFKDIFFFTIIGSDNDLSFKLC